MPYRHAVDPIASDDVRRCPRCGAAVWLDNQTCVSCLLGEGKEAGGECSSESFDEVLSEIDLPDREWLLGNYQILEEIGRGGMGVIYKARQRHSRRIVAVKRILSYEAESHETLERFRREAETIASLDHANILPIYEVSESENGVPFFSMKLATGGSLRTAAASLTHDPKACVRIVAKIARALEYAHNHGVLHRDLQPGNILLDAHGEPLISDFGLAKQLDADSNLTRTRTAFGTPGYIAPEQAEGSPADLTPAADIYSLGAILFSLLARRPPFLGDNPLSVIRQAASVTAPRLRSIQPSIDRDLETIVARCLESEPRRRYASAGDLAEDLERWLASEPIRARPVSPVSRAWRWSLRNPLLASTAAACLLLAVALGELLFRNYTRTGSKIPVADKSVAVLPFENLTPDQGDPSFTAGIQDDILTSLGRIADLKVISRSSVRDYKAGAPRKLNEIAKALGVRHLIEGSVRRAGNSVRISAYLTDAITGTQLWAEHYDRDIRDIFTVQTELAQAITTKLRAHISPDEKAIASGPPTTDVGAYELYLQAKELTAGALSAKDSAARLRNAVELLGEATRRDPTFVLAYCLSAKISEDLYWNDMDRTPERLEKARSAIESAKRLGPKLGETHLAEARYRYIAFREYDAARAELEHARRALPNDTDVLALSGLIARRQSRWADALRDLRRANELDPRNAETVRALADTFFELRRYNEMEQLLKRAVATLPKDALMLYAKLADCYFARGEPKTIIPFFKLGPPNAGASGFGAYYRFTAYFYLRDFEQAKRALGEGPPDIPDSFKGPFCPKEWFQALIARAEQQPDAAAAFFATARQKMQMMLETDSADPARLSVLARIDAALGHKEEAISEGERALASRPLEIDALDGPMLATSLALVYAWTGERDSALELLSKVSRIPAGPTYGDLALSPRWDPLRSDSRFQAIVDSLRPAPATPHAGVTQVDSAHDLLNKTARPFRIALSLKQMSGGLTLRR